MKRLGKPDTGNPFVRFDEERSGSVELTTTVGSIRLLPLRLLYRKLTLPHLTLVPRRRVNYTTDIPNEKAIGLIWNNS